MPGALPTTRVVWEPAVRLLSDEYPPIDAIESARTPEDLAEVLELLQITGTVSAGTRAAFDALPEAQRRSGPGAWAILAPFLYPSTGRFSSVRRGAFYVARTAATATAEWCFHRERLLLERGLSRAVVGARELHVDVDVLANDARGAGHTHPELYDEAPGGNDATRALADTLPEASLVYDSLRDAGGECLAIFRPDTVTGSVVEAPALRLAWSVTDGWARRRA